LLARGGSGLVGAPFFERFEVERPAGVADIEGLARSGRPLMLRLVADATLRLRGVALLRREGLWLLMGHIPDFGRADGAPPLTFADFSPIDGTLDMLLAAEIHAGLLAEAQALAEALEAQKKAAEHANVAKSAFLATMSHEIRTPMNAVLGLATILADTELSAPQREMLDVMTTSGRLLMETLDDVLDISKIESGKMDLDETTFDVAAMARSAGSVFASAALSKGLDFEVAVDAPQPWRRGDPVRIRQILVNLIANAVKFTDAGGVRVRATMIARAGGPVFEIVVSDTGIGMSAEAMGRLFTPFEQASGATTRRYGGTGLGLAITKLLCDRMGGSIRAESRLGRGSVFTVEVPLPEGATPITAAADAPGEGGRASPMPHVLVVEDNPTNRFVLSLFLQKIGVTFDIAKNGAEALIAWERGRYDVVLMDIEMPVLDGLETTRELRRREAARGGRRTTIIGLSADAMLESDLRARRAGMDDFVTKPIDIDRLHMLIRPRFDAGAGGGAGASPAADAGADACADACGAA